MEQKQMSGSPKQHILARSSHIQMKINVAEYNQQDSMFHNLFNSVRRSACFRRFFRPTSGAQNRTYSVRYLSDQYLTLYVQF